MTTKLKALLIGLVIALSLWKSYSLGAYHKDLEWQKIQADHQLEDSQNASIAQSKHNERSESLSVVREEQEQAHALGISDLRDRLADLSRVNSGLQDDLAATTDRLRRAEQAASNAGVNATAAKASMVLSDLLGKATRQLELVSGTADEWRLNAEGCHAFYEEIRSH